MNFIPKKQSIFVLTFLVSNLLIALTSLAQLTKNITSINNERNFSFNCAVQASDGVIWYGTNKGVIKFDGEKFSNFGNNKGLFNSPVTAIFIDKFKSIWLGHSNGKISIFKDNKFSPFIFNDKLGNQKITAITENNGVWIGTYGDGVYFLDINKKLVHYSSENGMSDNAVYTLCNEDANKVWAGTDGGLTCFNKVNGGVDLSIISMKKGLPDNIVRNIILAKNGDLVIAMQDSGICVYKTKYNTFKKASNWKYGAVNSVIEFEPNTFYIATEKNGIYKSIINNEKVGLFSKLNYTEGVDCRELNFLMKDRESNLWFLKKNGLTLFSHSRWKLFDKNNGLLADTILSVFIDSKNNCWIGSNKGLQLYTLPSFYENTPSVLTFKQQIFDKEVTCIFEDSMGNIWFGTYGFGLHKYNPKTSKLKSVSLNNEYENDNVSCITSDSQNKIWVATLGGGISVIEDYNGVEQVKNIGVNEGLSISYIYSILCDSENLRWVGTDGLGLVEHTAGIFIKVNEKSNIDAKSVYSIVKSHSGNVWFNMSENGIYKFDGSSISNYNTGNGLSDNNPLSIVTNKNQVMVVHSNGIDILNEKNNQFKYYYFNDFNLEPNLNASFADKKGNIYIGTNKGLVLFNSGALLSDPLSPLVSFSNISINNDLVNTLNKGKFKSNQNNITFNYHAVWFKIGEKIKYKYKLVGIDKGYKPTENKSISYSGLQPGKYTFYLSASNGEGNWSKPIVYSFTIAKPLWQLWWVWIIAVVLIYIAIYVIIKYRVNLLKREKKILEHKVQLRTQEIVNQSKIIEAKNKDITDSIEYAKKIQDSILPNIDFIKQHLPQSFIFYKQKDIVSGDFYWFTVKQNIIVFAAVDCTGHGVPGAFMSLIGNNILNQIVNEKNITNPASILMQLNDGVLKALYGNKTYAAAKDGMDIGICAIDHSTQSLLFSGAMRPLYFCRAGNLEEISGDKVSIGTHLNEGVHKDFTFKNKEIKFEKDDVFYLSTDGYADQFGGEKGKKMMKKNFKTLLQLNCLKGMEQQEKIVSESFMEWKGNFEQVDDILVIGFKL